MCPFYSTMAISTRFSLVLIYLFTYICSVRVVILFILKFLLKFFLPVLENEVYLIHSCVCVVGWVVGGVCVGVFVLCVGVCVCVCVRERQRERKRERANARKIGTE